ncbi:MAG: holo-ACP synthase, partial [Oscillospiraceae bacterium]
MIYGVGNDLVEISRIAKSMQTERFMTFVFSQAERTAFWGNAQKLSGCFAAKEALSKALGTGVRGFSMDEISVLRDELEKPYFVFEGEIADIMLKNKLTAFVALTNTAGLALANVVLETE